VVLILAGALVASMVLNARMAETAFRMQGTQAELNVVNDHIDTVRSQVEDAAELRDSQVMRLKRLHPGTVIKAAVRQVLVPLPLTSRVGGSPLTDGPLLEWVETLGTKILVPFGE